MVAAASRLGQAPDLAVAGAGRSRTIAAVRAHRRWGGAAAVALAAALALALILTAVRHDGSGPRALTGGSGIAGLHRLQTLPLGAQAMISRTLGATQRAFQARSTSGGYSLAAGGLEAGFTRAGMKVSSADGSLSLRLAAVGHGGQLSPVGSVLPHARANRVAYDDAGASDAGDVQTWYAAGPLGIEQGFTLARRPVGQHGPLTLALSTSGKLSPRLVDGGQGLLFSNAAGRVTLRYGGLEARDAKGRPLRASFAVSRGVLWIRVADRGAAYPLHIDPFVQAAKLTAAGAVENDALGYSVAISGTTVFAGTPTAKVGANEQQGAVYVFTQPAGGWSNETEAAKLTASDGAGYAQLGESVAVSGTTVFAGDPRATVGSHEQQGAVYVFTEPAGGWSNETQTAKLTASDGAESDRLGSSVAVSGTTAIAGAPGAKLGANERQGAAYVFTQPGGGWSNETQAAKLTASDGAAQDELGYAVAISGTTAIAGAPLAKVGANERQGAAYVFTQPGGGWSSETQTAKLTASDGAKGAVLGYSVAASGTTVFAGAPYAKIGANEHQGAAYVFTQPGGGWSNETQAAKLTASNGAAAAFLGASLAVSGTTVLVGAPDADVGSNGYEGAAYVFTQPPGGWSGEQQQAETLTNSRTAGYGLGFSVAVSGDTVLASAPFISDGPGEQSTVYVFTGEPTTPSPKWYSDGHLIGEGQKVSVKTSGSLTLQLVGQAGEPKTKCKASDTEIIENPPGGGAGIDEITAFALSGCKTSSTLCPGKLQFTSLNLPWHTRLTAGPPIRDIIEHIALSGVCEEMRELLRLEGTLMPTVGTSVLEFATGAGELGGNYGQATVTGTDKLKGPKGDTTITVKEG
jgi:FG-GAP repeat